MATITDIVQITINTQAVTPQAPGFGEPAVVAYDAPNGSALVTHFTGTGPTALAAMVTAGYATSSPTYLAVQKAFSQNPAPLSVAVLACPTKPTKQFTVTPVYAGSTGTTTSFVLTINSVNYTVTGVTDVNSVAGSLLNQTSSISGITAAGVAGPSALTLSESSVNVNTLVGTQTITCTASTAGFASSGTISVGTSTGTAVVSYTGITGDTFTDCTLVSGTGIMTSGAVNAFTALTYTANSAGAWFQLGINNNTLFTLLDTSTYTATNLITDLDACILSDSTWYALNVDAWGKKAIILDAATFAQANNKLLVTQTVDTLCVNSTQSVDLALAPNNSVMSALQAAYSNTNDNHVATIYATDSGAFSGIAWLGARLPLAPGSENWMFASLAGVTATSPLNGTQVTNLKAKYGNYYYTVGGVNITATGQLASGSFIDLTRGADWLSAIIQTGIFAVLTSTGQKVPYTDPGIAQLTNVVRGCLDQAIIAGYLAARTSPAYTVTAPLAANANPTDRANRVLNAITFSASAAGAINDVKVIGTILL